MFSNVRSGAYRLKRSRERVDAFQPLFASERDPVPGMASGGSGSLPDGSSSPSVGVAAAWPRGSLPCDRVDRDDGRDDQAGCASGRSYRVTSGDGALFSTSPPLSPGWGQWLWP